jgi:signal transduction histidine kinase/ActR/RegA family two-component response regulator
VVGKKIDDMLGLETMKTAGEYIDRALRGEEAHFQPEVQYPAGPRWVDAHYIPDFDAAGQVAGFCVLVLDVTQRKLAEDALRQSEARLWAILDHLSVGVALADPDGRLVLSNSTMRRYVPERMPSRDPARIDRWRVAGDAVPPGGWAAERALRGETVRPGIEFSYRGDDGRDVWLLTTAVPFRGTEGEVLGAIVVLQDITANKEMNRALQAADRRKDEFLATLAHEIRNPLAPMMNSISLLRLDVPEELRAKSIAILDRQLRHVVRLIDDLLDVSRISTGKLSLHKEDVDLLSVLRSALELIEPVARERQLALVWRPNEADCMIEGDPARLLQVFSNLLSNACRYTPMGGRVTVAVQCLPGNVEVAVEDTGVGIDASMQERIFELFEQGDKSLERGNTGLGIGLTLARQLVTLHGGTLRVQSEGPGRGSRFIVGLPLPAQARHAPVRPAPPEQARGERLRVLLADDNVDYVDSMQTLLEAAGLAVTSVYDGLAAVAAAQSDPPDVAILDIGMPGLNGYEVARRLRAAPATAAAALIAVSGWGQESDKREAFAAGFDRHLVKPVSAQVLLETLATVREGENRLAAPANTTEERPA